MSDLLYAMRFKAGVALACAALASIIVAVAFAAMHGAAWFAFGNETPAFPWWLLRFFLAIGWILSAFVGLFARTGEKPS